jgi:hypothetical protein
MKLRIFGPVLLAGLALIFSSGCAVFSKGRTQSVVVRSTPSGAAALINGIEVGKTPLRVDMPRSSAHTLEVRKAGFENAIAVVLPVANEYEKRFFRWGVDYDLGAMTDLTPNDIQMVMSPAIPSEDRGDSFQEMSYRVLQADALLAAKEISPSDHKYIVAEIVKFYSR